jgi:hypothetical protein
LKGGKGELYEGDVRQGKKATVTVGVEDEDFVKLVGGQLDGTKVSIKKESFLLCFSLFVVFLGILTDGNG